MDPTVPTPAAAGGVLDRLGARAARRADPRVSIALAAAGCALVVVGVLVISGDGLGAGSGDDGSRLPGVLLSTGVVAGGLFLLARGRTGPLAAAGTVATALGVPALLFFLTFDDDSLPPYSTEAILYLSTLAWAAAYGFGPGRSRPFFLGAACLGLWLSVLQAVEEVFTFPFGIVSFFLGVSIDEDVTGPFAPDVPDPMTIGGISLALGATFLLVARWCDRHGYAGTATPLTVAALVTLPVGVGFLADEFHGVGAGLVGVVIGFYVAAHGASVGRRATTWLGAAGVAWSVVAIVTDLVDDATPGGFVLMLVGAGVIVAAEALRRATNEPDELTAGPSPFALQRGSAAGPIEF